MIEKVEAVPASVVVKGPRNRIKKQDRVRTTPVDVSAFTQSSEVEADLILPHPDLRLATPQSAIQVAGWSIGSAAKKKGANRFGGWRHVGPGRLNRAGRAWRGLFPSARCRPR